MSGGWSPTGRPKSRNRSEEHTSELQSQSNLVCRLLLEKKKNTTTQTAILPHPSSIHPTTPSKSDSPRYQLPPPTNTTPPPYIGAPPTNPAVHTYHTRS